VGDRYVACGYRNWRGRAVFKVATSVADLWFRLPRNSTRAVQPRVFVGGFVEVAPEMATAPRGIDTPTSNVGKMLLPRSSGLGAIRREGSSSLMASYPRGA
jgi:hypothetical protein